MHYEDFFEVLNHGENEAKDQFIFAWILFVVNNIYYTIYTGYDHSYSKLEWLIFHAGICDLISSMV